MAIIDDFKTRFPEFDPVVVDAKLPSLEGVYHCYYGLPYKAGTCSQEIILNLLAHLMVRETSESAAPTKDISSKSADGLSVTFSQPQGQSETSLFFSTTKYGQNYLMLTKSRIGGFFV